MATTKQIPNIITGVRIICSLLLLFTAPLSPVFFAGYLLGGLSDILDGYIARKLNLSSRFGAVFDSVADIIFVFVLLLIFIPYIQWPLWCVCWMAIILSIRVLTLIVGFLKFHAFAFLHTYANKATGLLLTCFPLIYWLVGLNSTAVLLCSLATLSALEELLISLISKTLDRDVTSVFARR